jgi:integrase
MNEEVKICRNGLVALEDRKFMVDSELKEEFLTTLNSNTAKTVKGILLKVDKYEKDINKSAYNFSLQDVNELIESEFSNKSIASIRSNVSYIRKYINYCIEHNFTNINQFNLITDFAQYVDKNAMENKYITYEQLLKIEDMLVNFCDRCMLELLFSGVKPDECINLKAQDIDFYNKTLILTDKKNNKRKVLGMDDRCFELLRLTINQEEYYINNGSNQNRRNPNETFGQGLGIRTLKFPKSEYVFKTVGGKKENEPMRARGLQDRVRIIRDWVNNPYITVTNLYLSGILYEAFKLMSKYKVKELDRYTVAQLADRFNYCKGFVADKTDGHLVVNSRVGRLQEIIRNGIKSIYNM